MTQTKEKAPQETAVRVSPIITRRRKFVRRLLFSTTWLIVEGIGLVLFADFLWRTGLYGLKWALIPLFAILFGHIALGFCTSLFGFIMRRLPLRAGRITQTLTDREDVGLAPTAILFPIYNEDVARVFAGVEAVYKSLERTGQLEHFDFYILSDSRNPDRWVEEEVAWLRLAKDLGAVNRIHYRRRHENTNKKSGNIDNFLEAWGARYRYMVVFDADSLMTGESLVKLVRLMEANPQTGLIQTAPGLINGHTLFARAQQFANRLYGAIFAAGLNFWQQGEGNYWGHNAIIRVAPFMEHCKLPTLPYKEPIGGKILSHDFVEAALMRRAGFDVWLAEDVGGSFEEGPPNLRETIQRDQRWCQGNLQHAWLLFARPFTLVNRFHFVNGILSYASALFWLIFLVLSTLTVIAFERSGLTLFVVSGFASYVELSIEEHALVLILMTAAVLFTPKVLSVLDLLFEPERRRGFGGILAASASAVIETLLSALLAPILMFWHSLFMVTIPFGSGVSWGSQARSSTRVTFTDALSMQWPWILIAAIWGTIAWAFSTQFFWWLLPVLLGPLLSVPLAMFVGSRRVGEAFRKARLLRTPEEVASLPEQQETHLVEQRLSESLGTSDLQGSRLAFVDPYVNAVHCALLQEKPDAAPTTDVDRLVREGASALDPKELLALLEDRQAVSEAYRRIWRSSPSELAPEWRAALQYYASATPEHQLGFG